MDFIIRNYSACMRPKPILKHGYKFNPCRFEEGGKNTSWRVDGENNWRKPIIDMVLMVGFGDKYVVDL